MQKYDLDNVLNILNEFEEITDRITVIIAKGTFSFINEFEELATLYDKRKEFLTKFEKWLNDENFTIFILQARQSITEKIDKILKKDESNLKELSKLKNKLAEELKQLQIQKSVLKYSKEKLP